MKRFLSLLALLGLLAVTGSAEKISLGSGKALHLTLPATWISADLPTRAPGVPEAGQNVRYVTKSGSNDALLIAILPVPDDRFNDPENLKGMVEMATQQFVAGSVEGQANLKELKFGGVSGLAATFTDANLVGKPSVKEDYKAMTSCFAYLGERVMVTATIFTDDLDGKAYAEGLRILKSMSLQLPKDTI
jgi:hypothetical protein